LDGETVVLENIGNVNYDDYVTVGMNSAQQNITLKKKVFLKPQTMFSFDLSKEVTDGDYTVTLPSGEIIGNVHLTDSRNFLKRTFDGIRGISGNAVTIVDSGSGAFWGFLVAIAVIGLLVGGAYYFKMPKSSPKAQPQKQQDRDTVPAFDEHGNIIRNGPRK
jgi:hypothetical protein